MARLFCAGTHDRLKERKGRGDNASRQRAMVNFEISQSRRLPDWLRVRPFLHVPLDEIVKVAGPSSPRRCLFYTTHQT